MTRTMEHSADEIAAAAERAGAPSRHALSKTVYNALEPAFRTLARKGYTMRQAVRWLTDQGYWKGTEQETEALYRAMCYRLHGRGKKKGGSK